MSSDSPAIYNGGHVDSSITFGKSVLDGEVPYPADMAGLPTSTPNPSAVKRRTRKSWFETTPSGTRLEIAVEKPAPKAKRLSGEVEVLTLSHFTAAPRLDFGNMKPGQVKTCTLLLRNPHECEQTVKIEKVPEKKHFTVTTKVFTVGPGESYPLEVTWSPPEPGNFREMILMQVDKSYRLQAYVFGSVTAPPQKKKKRVGLLASKVSKPFSVIQTSSLASINHQYSPEKKQKPVENRRRSGRLSGQGTVPTKPTRAGNMKKPKDVSVPTKNGNVKNVKKPQQDFCGKAKETYRKTSLNNKENLDHKGPRSGDEIIPKKKMRRSNTYSNVSNQGLLIPVIHGEQVQGQMDTSLIEIVDKCNVSGIQALEQSFTSPTYPASAGAVLNNGSKTIKAEQPSFLENHADKHVKVEEPSFLETQTEKQSPDMDRILSQIIPYDNQDNNEPSFLYSNDTKHLDVGKQIVTVNTVNTRLQAVKDTEGFHDSLEEVNTNKTTTTNYTDEPSFLTPGEIDVNNKMRRRSTRRSAGKTTDGDQENETPEVRLLRSVKRRSGRRSITKEKRRSSSNKSGAKSIVEQLKSIRTFIKEKSFEIESGDEPSFLKSDNNSVKKDKILPENNCLATSPKPNDGQAEQTLRRDTFLADASKLKVLESQKPSEASPRRTTFTVLRKNPSLKSPARSRSEGHKPQNALSALDEAINENDEASREMSAETVKETVIMPVQVENINSVKESCNQGRKSESPKRLYSVDSLENDSFGPMIHSPKQIKLDNPEFERRATLTVTKSRPSDALLHQMEIQTAKLFQTADNSMEITSSDKVREQRDEEMSGSVNKNSTFEKTDNSSKTPEVSFPSTPNQLPTSPNPDHSRRSTHCVKQPKVVDVSKMEQRELFAAENSDSRENCDSRTEENHMLDSPANNTRRRLSGRLSGHKNLSSQYNDCSKPRAINSETVEQESIKETEQARMKETEKEARVKETEQGRIKETEKEVQRNSIEKAEVQSSGLLFIPMDNKVKAPKENNAAPSRPKTVVDPKQFLRKRSTSAAMPVNTMADAKRVKREKKETDVVAVKPGPAIKKRADRVTKPAPKEIDKQFLRKRSTSSAMPVNTMADAKRVKREKKETDIVAVKPGPAIKKRADRVTKPAPKEIEKRPRKPISNSVKGLAQSKLILVKKTKTALPKHPLPFAAKNMYYDERWMEKQERGFVNWLNFVLTPAEEYQGNDVKVKVDAGKLSVDVAKGSVKLAPTNEVLSFRAYSAHRKLNRLRKSACRLFQSESVVKVIQKLEGEVESGRLAVRKDKMLHADLGAKQKILDMLLSYNPLWLRIGIETIYGEVVPLQCNSDVFGLSRFILTRLLTSPDISQEYAHPTVPHLYRDGYAEATAAHSLKKFLMLVYFLDKAKQERLIEHNPCLFCKNSELKASKDLLHQFSRDLLSGEGDITRHLGYLGYKVAYTQTALDEFDFAVSNLSTDLRDGLRLTKVMELLCSKPELSKTLRVPAISRLQKVHNVEVVFKALTEQNIHTDNVTARDIVDGHREKSLRLLWNIILHYQIEILLNEAQLKEEIDLLEKSLKVKNQLQRLLKYTNSERPSRDSEGPDLHTQNPRLNLLLKWCKAVCAFYNIKVENFTVSFSDGRALCHIIHYYHPGLLPLDSIHNDTSCTHLEKIEKNRHKNMDASFNDSSLADFGDTEDPEVYQQLLNNEKENFKILFDKVKELGGIPLMLKWSDMSNTIPDEKVVVTYLLYLCARLLDIRHESRAARVIQLAWRKYRVKHAEKEFEIKEKAASKIQKVVRDFLARRRHERREGSVVVLQRVWRGYHARLKLKQLKLEKQMAQQQHAVCLLQRAVLGYLHRRRYVQMKTSITQFQAHCRGYLMRKKRSDAAVVIQSAWRSYIVRKHVDKMRSTIVKIQSCIRGYTIRKEFENYKNTVISVQRRFRANLAAKKCQRDFVYAKKSCVVIQKYWRSFVARRNEKRERTAVKIQAVFRGYLERMAYLNKRKAVVVLQSAIRGYIKRSEFLHKKKGVVTIQKHFRNYLTMRQERLNYLELREATIFLQAQRRMVVERRRYEGIVRCVVKIQSTVRMFLERVRYRRRLEAQRYLIEWGAAITIQSVVRGFLVRRHVAKQNKAVIVIQACFRQVVERRRYLTLRTAVLKCQTRVRANILARQQRLQYERLKQASVTVQKLYRGKHCRQQYLKDRDSVIKLQACIRMVNARRSYMAVKSAVNVMQVRYRAKKAGDECRQVLLTMCTAARTIQSVYRGYCVRRDLYQQHRAATVIQARVRGMLQRSRLQRLRKVTVMCQHNVRAKLAGKQQLLNYLTMKKAAVAIQKFYRAQKCRSSYRTEYRKIVKVQSLCRMYLDRQRYLKQKQAAVTLQRRFRAKQLANVCQNEYNNLRKAAITLQAAFRGMIARRDINNQHEAAVCIQKHVKSFTQRRSYLKQKQAAVVIQRRFRAKQLAIICQNEYNNVRKAAITLQAAFRGMQVRKDINKQHSAAVCIQKHVRRFTQRRRYLEQKHSAVVIQRRFRAKQLAFICQNEYNNLRMAARTLQAAFRGMQVRKYVNKQHRAAVCMQKHVRRFTQRRRYLEQKHSAVVIQRRFRAKQLAIVCQNEYNNLKMAAITLQAAFRGMRTRKDINKQHRAAVSIQKHVRKFIQRKRYLQLMNAVVTVQRLYRANKATRCCRDAYLRQKTAVVIIQAAWRGCVIRREVHRQHTAATCIQKYVKAFIQRRRYTRTKTATITIQRLYLAKREMTACRNQYLQTKSAAMIIQRIFRGYKVRREIQHQHMSAMLMQAVYRGYTQRCRYLKLKLSVIACQRRYRANVLCKSSQVDYHTVRNGVIRLQALVRGNFCRKMYRRTLAARTIQSVYRMYRCRTDYQSTRHCVIKCQAVIRGFLARTRYNQHKQIWNAACILQRRWRARVKGQGQRRSFLEVKRSAVMIQKYFRGKTARHDFQMKKTAVVKLQAAVRGLQHRRRFSHQKQAAVKLQSVLRGYMCRRRYLHLKNTVIMCQTMYRAKLKGKLERQNFIHKKKGIVKIQSVIRGILCRREYKKIVTSTVKIQSAYRVYVAKKSYNTWRSAARVLQTHWRAELLCRQHVFKYQALKDAAIIVQKNYRAKKVRENYLQKIKSIRMIQSNIRVWAAIRRMRELLHRKRAEREAMLVRFVKAALVHRAAIQIQRCYRNYHMMKIAREKVHSVTLIQRWIRVKLQRKHYLQDREKVVCLQKHVRCWLAKRNTAACVIQRAVRRWMGTFDERKKIRAAKKIQAMWKGYCVRRRSTSKKIAAARKRVMEANACATEENKLYNRTTSALDYLLKYKQMSYLLDALKDLELTTRLSWSCCERMVEANAVPVLYKLIRSCNRSLPHMEIIQITADIMLNLAKYDKTRASLYEDFESCSTLIELLQIYRQKGLIFIKTCTLLGILCLDSPCKTALLNDKKLTEKLRSIHKLTSYKHKVEETQRKTRAKMNATFNVTMSMTLVRSPEKRHKIKPDWSLNKDRLKDFDNPLKAINFVLSNLGLSAK